MDKKQQSYSRVFWTNVCQVLHGRLEVWLRILADCCPCNTQVKFFPIFFKEAVVLSPGATNLVMAVTPLALAFASFFAQAVAAVIGRWWLVVGWWFVVCVGWMDVFCILQ